jgi:hypothetical protein
VRCIYFFLTGSTARPPSQRLRSLRLPSRHRKHALLRFVVLSFSCSVFCGPFPLLLYLVAVEICPFGRVLNMFWAPACQGERDIAIKIVSFFCWMCYALPACLSRRCFRRNFSSEDYMNASIVFPFADLLSTFSRFFGTLRLVLSHQSLPFLHGSSLRSLSLNRKFVFIYH